MKLLVVIPTYNEKENIVEILTRIENVFTNTGIEGGIIVVDDNSPDKTADIVKDLSKKISTDKFKIELIQREGKLGLGTAYIAGFKKALEIGCDYVMEMDADFSHDPKYIPVFVRELQDSDVVIGSRYIKKGEVQNWSWVRKFISKSGSIYAKLILWWGIKDATSGFIAYKKEVLQKINLDKITSNGYSFQIEMKYRAKQLGFKLKEVPIVFIDRVNGVSKMNKSIVREAVKKVLALRFTK